MSDKPWMWSVFSEDEINELVTQSSRIVWNQDNGMVVNLTLSNNQCMDFLHHYFMTRETEMLDVGESVEFIEGFLFDLMNHVEKHLDNEAPHWEDAYYGTSPDEGDDEEEPN